MSLQSACQRGCPAILMNTKTDPHMNEDPAKICSISYFFSGSFV